jgi:hypothetical protein
LGLPLSAAARQADGHGQAQANRTAQASSPRPAVGRLGRRWAFPRPCPRFRRTDMAKPGAKQQGTSGSPSRTRAGWTGRMKTAELSARRSSSHRCDHDQAPKRGVRVVESRNTASMPSVKHGSPSLISVDSSWYELVVDLFLSTRARSIVGIPRQKPAPRVLLGLRFRRIWCGHLLHRVGSRKLLY